jgi:hypothetical protein
MKITTKSLITIFALSIPAPALAQPADLSQDGDYYAPGRTIVEQPTPQETKQFQEGDYYAPDKTTVRRSTPREKNLIRQGDYYAPGRY